MNDAPGSASPDRRPEWEPDSTFDQRYQSAYEPALACSFRVTGDFHESQDIVQEAFSWLHQRMAKGPDITRSYFFGLVRNRSIDAFREQIRRRKIGQSESECGSGGEDGKNVPFLETRPDEETPRPDQAAEQGDAATLIEQMRDSLTQTQREVFDFGAQNISQEQAAIKLCMTVAAFKSAWARTRNLLRDRFGARYATLELES